ncbi:MAG TPA: hypothetical protein VGO47_09830, partial [Chlamydiales bacterium]|nr:hypothetical protein [Chlamydiales bacterium]
ANSVEIAQFKRQVYHKVCDHIFDSLRNPSHYGGAVKCGDGISRVLFPGFLIHAVDGKEACSTCGCRGARANHPCPHCLADKEELTCLTNNFEMRTQKAMQQVYYAALVAKLKSSKELILRRAGLHLVKVSQTVFLLLSKIMRLT